MKTLALLILLQCMALGAQVSTTTLVPTTSPASGLSVMLTWDPNVEATCMGYRILSGPAPRIYNMTNLVNGRFSAAGTVSNVPPGKVYFAVVAIDASGVESDFSNEVVVTNKTAAPKNLRLIGTIQASASQAGPWKDVAQVSVPVLESQQYFRTKILMEEER